MLLLHGLGASSDCFGRMSDCFDEETLVIVPDLMGFARSRQAGPGSYSMGDHTTAVLQTLDQLAQPGLSVDIGAHSMGRALGLEVARRLGDRAASVTLWGAPIYESPSATSIEVPPMTRLMLMASPLARPLCHLNESLPNVMGWVWAALSPTIPAGIARFASESTWASFEGSVRSLVVDVDWRRQLDLSVPVTIMRGVDDKIGDRQMARELADDFSHVRLHEVPGAGHHVPITHCRVALDDLAVPSRLDHRRDRSEKD